MYAVIDEMGNIRASHLNKEDCEVELMTMADFHPLDGKVVIDLDHPDPTNLNDYQKYGVLRGIIRQKAPKMEPFLEDLITDHEWYKECMNPQFAEEEDND